MTAKGRRRFRFVCTMAERDYALEMWRLLDPEAHLISPKQLTDHVVCVKSGKNFHIHQNYNFYLILIVKTEYLEFVL